MGAYHGECHTVNLMFVLSLVLSKGAMPEFGAKRNVHINSS